MLPSPSLLHRLQATFSPRSLHFYSSLSPFLLLISTLYSLLSAGTILEHWLVVTLKNYLAATPKKKSEFASITVTCTHT